MRENFKTGAAKAKNRPSRERQSVLLSYYPKLLGCCFFCCFCGRSFLCDILILFEKSADGKAYIMSLFIDIDNLCLNLFALLENIGGMSQLLICYLRNVNKSVNAGEICAKAPNGVMETTVTLTTSPTL